ncbi:hypothetical protein CR513_58150, partial [Mucuna pruriens]
MTRFLNGLNKDIQDIVELYHYNFMDDVRHLTLKRTYPRGASNWRGKEKEKERPRKDKSPRKGSFSHQG